jgi:hypothetical protein
LKLIPDPMQTRNTPIKADDPLAIPVVNPPISITCR